MIIGGHILFSFSQMNIAFDLTKNVVWSSKMNANRPQMPPSSYDQNKGKIINFKPFLHRTWPEGLWVGGLIKSEVAESELGLSQFLKLCPIHMVEMT